MRSGPVTAPLGVPRGWSAAPGGARRAGDSLIAELRGDKATAVRMVGLSNEYLWDGGLRVALGKAAPDVMAAFNDASCAAASGHGGQCVDLRPVLNGPEMKTPANANTQESMDAVAAAVAALGLAELGVE